MKKNFILIIYLVFLATKFVFLLETNEKKNVLLLKDIKNNVVKDMVRLFDSNFDFLKGLNEIKYKQENIENLPNKYLNKLRVTNSLYTSELESKNLKSKLMRVKNLHSSFIDNKIATIDSLNDSIMLNNVIKLSKINNDSSKKREEVNGLSNLFKNIINLPNFHKRINFIIDNNPELMSSDDNKEQFIIKLKQPELKQSNYKNKNKLNKKQMNHDYLKRKDKKEKDNLDKLVNEFNDELIKDNIALKKSKI